jgi:hypothetical protein
MSGIEQQQAPPTGFSLVLTGRAAEEVQKFIAQEQVPVGQCAAGWLFRIQI